MPAASKLIPVADGSTVDTLSPVVKRSLEARGWSVTEQGDGFQTAALSHRGTDAEIRIDYGAEGFTINSTGGSTDGRYSSWITNLSRDIMIRSGISREDATAYFK